MLQKLLKQLNISEMHKVKIINRTILFSLTLFLASIGNAFAANKYKVEIIIFSNLSQQSLNAEHWTTVNPTINIPANARMINTDTTNENPNTIITLPPQQMRLTGAAKRIARYPDYSVLAHFAWIQDFNKNAGPIYLSASSDDGMQKLTGLINIRREHFFNTNYHLLLSVNNAAIQNKLNKNNMANSQNDYSYFLLDQESRMKSDEINYIDYPTLGALIRITRLI
jgi:hypothetical protein